MNRSTKAILRGTTDLPKNQLRYTEGQIVLLEFPQFLLSEYSAKLIAFLEKQRELDKTTQAWFSIFRIYNKMRA
jgi:hypothetical protein